MRVALVHDWLTGMRGGERCLEVFCELFPDADLFTLVHVPGRVAPIIERRRIVTSFIQHLPAAATRYRHYVPLMPAAIGRFDFRGYDLVLSSSHCVAKGARPAPGSVHVCYCFTPMRYVWDRYDDYVGGEASLAARLAMPVLAPALRVWDRASTRRVHHFVAISEHVRARVCRAYGRDAAVIYPPVDVQRFELADGAEGDFYLVVSALVPYKRVDLAIHAANALGRRLVVVGIGPEESRLRALAGPTVEFLGWRSDAEIAHLYRECRAVLFPGCEDFGIVPLEAMAAGRPVIALAAGGALETIVPPGGDAPPTGLLFEDQSAAGMTAAIRRFESDAWYFSPKALRARAERFGRERFRTAIRDYLAIRLAEPRPC
jgi:glycosyltransferase involved in cell wall biosynthesis